MTHQEHYDESSTAGGATTGQHGKRVRRDPPILHLNREALDGSPALLKLIDTVLTQNGIGVVRVDTEHGERPEQLFVIPELRMQQFQAAVEFYLATRGQAGQAETTV